MVLDQQESDNYNIRLKKGLRAEVLVRDYVRSVYGLNIISRPFDESDEYAKLDNFKWGDLELIIEGRSLYHAFIDVKCGNFIAKTSAMGGFCGLLYILTPEKVNEENVKDSRVIKKTTIKNYAAKIKSWRKGPSGSDGYYFSNIENSMRLDDFCVDLVKTYLMSDQFEGISKLMIQFNKRMPEGSDDKYKAK